MYFLKLLESIRTPLSDKLFMIITNIGDETFFLLIALYIFWCVSKKTGYFLMSVCFTGTVLNQFLKLIFRIPRPWVLDSTFSAVEGAIERAGGYSFPSGHTQNAFGIFGTLSMSTRSTAKRVFFMTVASLVAFSRMYLGVHTPLDVLTSVAISLLLVFAFSKIFEGYDKNNKMIYILLFSMLAFSCVYVGYIELYPFAPGIDAHNLAEGSKNAYTLLGGILAMCVSVPIERRYINFNVKAPVLAQIFKTAAGAALIVLIKGVLKAPLLSLFGGHDAAHMVRYFIVVAFAVLVWPLTFRVFSRSKKKKSK